ncbi:hypothetical protein ACFFLS_16735 [Flavobacterium procerum]|uniref:DUF2304 domain-containing protein n=1 Tax=Flavobacterium procerum TaxID=1455569 RepID=A0ABV6BTC7_9FLAO
MEFNFNTFFGYEGEINALNDEVLIYGFASLIFGILGLLILASIVRMIGLNAVSRFFINPLLLTLGLTILVAIFPTIIFYVGTSDVSGVKIVYCWIAIFLGMLLFVIFNLQTIKDFFKEFGKMSEQQAFRNRNRNR